MTGRSVSNSVLDASGASLRESSIRTASIKH
jgi:hypothetical protein